MRHFKKASVVVSVLSALVAFPAAASTTFQAYEIGGQPAFTGNGGPGSTITVQAVLVNPSNHSQVIGSKNEWCQIISYTAQGHPILFCDESSNLTGRGVIFAHGTLDEYAIEHYQPQTIQIYSSSGTFGGRTGAETIQQVVYPNELMNTYVLN